MWSDSDPCPADLHFLHTLMESGANKSFADTLKKRLFCNASQLNVQNITFKLEFFCCCILEKAKAASSVSRFKWQLPFQTVHQSRSMMDSFRSITKIF